MLLEKGHIRSFRKEDYPACAKIYKEGMSTGIATFETRVPEWKQWNKKFVTACRLVACIDDDIVGWIALSPFSSREVYKGVAEVTLYVASNVRGKGVGKQLLKECIDLSEKNGFWTLQAKIFSLNKPSLQLFENCGFRTVGVREKLGMRDGIWYDNVLMERRSKLK